MSESALVRLCTSEKLWGAGPPSDVLGDHRRSSDKPRVHPIRNKLWSRQRPGSRDRFWLVRVSVVSSDTRSNQRSNLSRWFEERRVHPEKSKTSRRKSARMGERRQRESGDRWKGPAKSCRDLLSILSPSLPVETKTSVADKEQKRERGSGELLS